MKQIFFIVTIVLISANTDLLAQCSESLNAYKNLSGTVNLSSEINCATDVVLNEVGSDGTGIIIFDQTLTWDSFSVTFQNGNKPAQFVIPAGITITILGDLSFSGMPNKDKFLVVEGTLIVGGTLALGDIPFEIDGSGTIDAGEITGGGSTTCEGDANCPTFNVDVCVEPGLCAEAALPIELLYLSGIENNSGVLLNWATATEENFDYFEIERATEGTSFDLIGEVKGDGNSYRRLDYSFTDDSPEIGLNYYRLKSIDLDGTFEYSDVILVRFTSNVKLLVSPNPTLGIISIKTSLPTTGGLNYEITSQYGVVVLSGSLEAYNTQIDLQGLNKGIYIIRLVDLPGVKAKRIILK